MSEFSWEFEAPTFVDFGANEHELSDNAEEYFERIHEEQESPSDFEKSSEEPKDHLAKASGSVKNSPVKNPVNFEEKIVSPSLTVAVKPMVQGPLEGPQQEKSSTEILPQSQNQEVPAANNNPQPSQQPSADNPAIQAVEATAVESSEATVESLDQPQPAKERKVISNIMTPSRLASWTTGRPAPPKQVPRRSAPSSKSTANKMPLRRSLRQNAKTPQPDPPMKKARILPDRHIPKVSLKKSAGETSNSHKRGTHQRSMTSEERDLAEMQRLRDEAKHFREEAKKLLNKIKHQQPQQAHHATTSVTQPHAFHFKTDERAAKTHVMSTRADASTSNPTDFTHELRKYAPSPVRKSKTTVTKPFHFSNQRKRKIDAQEQHVPFVPMAKAIIDFQSRTPRRYKTMRNNAAKAPSGPLKALHTTIPKTPQLSKPRNRPVTAISAKEKEEQEVQEMKNYKFKAQPILESVLNPLEPVKKIEKKPTTVPVEFSLATDHRMEHKPTEKAADRPKPFKAQPIPTHLLEKTTGIKQKESVQVTVPMSPAFALKNRIKAKIEKPKVTINEEPETRSFYRPPPKSTEVFAPKLPSHKTEPKPFSFDAKDKERFAQKDEKIKGQIEKEIEVAAFKAHPMPIPAAPSTSLPAKNVKEPTKSVPFNLNCDQRAAQKVDEWSKDVEEEVRELREKATFKANKDYEKITKGKPWEPKLRHKLPTEPLNVVLHSDVRAKQRGLYEQKQHQEAEERQRMLRDEEKRKAELQREELSALRRGLVHTAKDIKHYTGVEVHQSNKQLTIPESPNFSARFKK